MVVVVKRLAGKNISARVLCHVWHKTLINQPIPIKVVVVVVAVAVAVVVFSFNNQLSRTTHTEVGNTQKYWFHVNILKLDMLRQHKPPPIQRIRILDFGLPNPKHDPDRQQNCITRSLSHALPLQKISSKSVHKFASNPTDRQTDKQTTPKT